ncbi:O-antigen ligase family protein [Empedobacter brevis]|uniref:O-antigen ligase family protein n=1 Tax=Empedobacter brevis TaxID=247 RepID=UPI0021A9F5D2|nr:O-antigen ligase family protein [Empedobacter brevis]
MNIYFCFDLNLQENSKKYYIINFIFISFLILILARLSIITLIISIFIYLFIYSKYSVKIKSIIFLVLSSIILSFMLINPNTKERFNYESFEKFQDHEPRFVIWKSVSNILNNDDYNPLIGYGNSELVEDYLVINYENEIDKEDKMNYYVNERFNTHSQYLDYLLMGGIPLLLLFLSFIISLFIYFRKDYLSVIMLISIISFFGVENLFTRQLGCYLFIFYVGFSYLRIKILNNNSNFN